MPCRINLKCWFKKNPIKPSTNCKYTPYLQRQLEDTVASLHAWGSSQHVLSQTMPDFTPYSRAKSASIWPSVSWLQGALTYWEQPADSRTHYSPTTCNRQQEYKKSSRVMAQLKLWFSFTQTGVANAIDFVYCTVDWVQCHFAVIGE